MRLNRTNILVLHEDLRSLSPPHPQDVLSRDGVYVARENKIYNC